MSSDETTRPTGTDADPPSDELGASTLQVSDGDGITPSGQGSDVGIGALSSGTSTKFTSLWALWLNAAALGLALLSILPLVTDGTAIAIPDEGVYLAQADALTKGSWSAPIPAPDVDPDGVLHPMSPDIVVGERAILYARHATYPLLLTPFYWLGGYAGTLMLSIIGTWGAAVSGAFIARRLNVRYGLWALWLVGIGSPLLFDSYITVGHSVAAALAGIAFLGLCQAVDDRRWWALAYAAPAIVLLVLVRSEGFLWAAGLAAATATMAMGVPRRRPFDWPGMATAAGLGILSLTTYIADTRIANAISTRDGYGINPATIATKESVDPVSGLWASLVRPFHGTWASAGIFVPLAALGIVLGFVVLRIAPRRALLPLGFMCGAAAAGIGLLINEPGLVTGLFAAFPILLAGLVWLRKGDLEDPTVARALVATGIASVGIGATIFGVGGASEWGGRFFHLLLPILIPLVILGLANTRSALSMMEFRVALCCVAVVTLALSMGALQFHTYARTVTHDLTQGTVEYAEAQFGSDERPIVIVARLNPDGTARYFWDANDDMDVLTSYNLRLLSLVLREVKAAGRQRAVISTNINGIVFATTIEPVLDDLGWEVLDSDATPIGTMTLVTVGTSESDS